MTLEQWARGIRDIEASLADASAAIADATEALWRVAFELRRAEVDALLAAPWYRHLPERLRLLRAPSWAERWPAIE